LYFNALQREGIHSELHIYASGGHGFGLASQDPRLSTWTDLCYRWLRALPKERGIRLARSPNFP
jgi:hypothetical protein